MTDITLPDLPIDRLPQELQDIILDSHFQLGKKGFALSVRITEDMERAMQVILARLHSLGGIPWLETPSDLMRAGTFMFLALLKTTMEHPPESLNVIITSEIMQGQAQTRKVLTDRMKDTISLTSEHVFELSRDPNAKGEVKSTLIDLITNIEAINSKYWRNKWKQAVTGNMVLKTIIIQHGLLEEFEVEEGETIDTSTFIE